MKLWFARDGSVPIRDQIVTQLMLAIASGELQPGAQLPSTRALARRYRLNANTVSAAYQRLEASGLVESIHGSGVYVRTGLAASSQLDARLELTDRMVIGLLRACRSASLSRDVVRGRIDYWLGWRPRRFVFVHPDCALRAIACRELHEHLSWEVLGRDAADALEQYACDSVFLTLPSKLTEVSAMLPAHSEVISLRVSQVNRAIERYLSAGPEFLILVASGWDGFLEVARTVLTAVGYNMDQIEFRHANSSDWKRGLKAGPVVVCDVLTSEEIPEGVRRIVFPLVSEESIAELKKCERFFAE